MAVLFTALQETIVSQGLKLSMVGRIDKTRERNEYYFTRPNIPVSVDLSKCVVFVHPWEDKEAGSFGAELVFKEYRPPADKEAKLQ